MALLLLCFFAALSRVADGPSDAQPAPPGEYEIKAEYVLNFAQFIEWPPEVFSSPDAPITIGVLGSDPFGQTLEQTIGNETANGRRLVVKRSRQVEDLRSCQLVFISKSEEARLAEMLTSLDSVGVVTLGEAEDFCRRGGVIEFYMDGKKVRFSINVAAAEKRHLRISSQLLKRARLINAP